MKYSKLMNEIRKDLLVVVTVLEYVTLIGSVVVVLGVLWICSNVSITIARRRKMHIQNFDYKKRIYLQTRYRNSQ
jgi:hypothetical protein